MKTLCLKELKEGLMSSDNVRDDDNAEVLRQRLKVYHDNTAPVLPFYRKKGILSQVDGMMSIEEVAKNINEVLDS